VGLLLWVVPSVGSGWPVSPYWMCQVRFFGLDQGFWLWVEGFCVELGLGQKIWLKLTMAWSRLLYWSYRVGLFLSRTNQIRLVESGSPRSDLSLADSAVDIEIGVLDVVRPRILIVA
jgi:hypothetical protein